MENGNSQVAGMPEEYDRLLGALHGIPGVAATKPSTVKTVTSVTGASKTFIVQTYRQRDEEVREGQIIKGGDTIFLDCMTKEGTTRLAIPPAVADVIARQRESLTKIVRRRTAKASAQARKDAGILPGFLRGRTKGE